MRQSKPEATPLMALARIITRSQTCSRELAFNLMARGYAVEIVSPDRIPDNLADLELRVEEGSGNQLVASVAARNGDRTATLDFVHHLRNSMSDVERRPLEREALRPAVAISPKTAQVGAQGHWRSALKLVGVVVMALLLAFELQRTGKASAQAAAVSAFSPQSQTTSATSSPNLANSAAVVPITATTRDTSSIDQSSAGRKVAGSDAGAKTKNRRSRVRHHDDDVVAPNTVVYLDQTLAKKTK